VLYVVSTPIGNLEDITQRALRVLREVDLVLAEDTRRARVLLGHYGVRKALWSVREHNEARTMPRVLAELAAGRNLAFVTDAGTPLVSDPGSRLVASVREAGFRVVPVPGPSALTAALAGAGMDASRFLFFGFLPRRGRERRLAITRLSEADCTSVVYEAANRLAATLAELAEAGAAGRRAVVAREMTKRFEEFRAGTVGELAAYYAASPPRGEIVIVLEGKPAQREGQVDLGAEVQRLRGTGLSAREIASVLVRDYGVARNEAYRLAHGK
jgi:16S rRNA (cytidine1402-2'-O)-methyltransferase